jgi:uncharacterized protein (TIRG00374 family)
MDYLNNQKDQTNDYRSSSYGKSSTVKKIKRAIPYLIIFSVVIFYGFYIHKNADRYEELFNFSFRSIILLVLLIILSKLIRGMINFLLYRKLVIKISFSTSFGLAIVNTLANLLPFSGGLLAKGYYLKEKYKLAYTTFFSATVSLLFGFVTANGMIGLIVLLYLFLFQNIPPNILITSAFTIMTVSIVIQWIKIDYRFLPDKWMNRIQQVMTGWQLFRNNLRLFIQLIGLQSIATLLTAGRFWVAFRMLSNDIPFSYCLLFSAATILTQLISIAPGGLGIREGIVAGIAGISGIDPGLSAVAVGIDRLVSTTLIVVLGSLFSYTLSRDVLDETENAR